jgi:hypothetical protein
MPIEIKELIIKVNVADHANFQSRNKSSGR